MGIHLLLLYPILDRMHIFPLYRKYLLARSAKSLTNSMKSASERVEGGRECRKGYQMFRKSRGKVAGKGSLKLIW